MEEVLFCVSIYAEGREPINVEFSDIEYGDGYGNADWDEFIHDMWVEIVGGIDPTKDYSDEQMVAMKMFKE